MYPDRAKPEDWSDKKDINDRMAPYNSVLGWLARFYVTHYVHYICAALLIGFSAYIMTGYITAGRKKLKVTVTGYLGWDEKDRPENL